MTATGSATVKSFHVDGGLEAAERDFRARFPRFDCDGALAELRRTEYGRLDAAGHVYLDYTGGGLYAQSQVDAHAELLRMVVLGNPHSANPTSLAATAQVDCARRAVCRFLNAPPEDYLCVFTANASAALRLVGESYPFRPTGTLALSSDNHNSVNGIREFARRCGATISYVPVVAPELRLDRQAMTEVLVTADRAGPNLLAFPAQSNYSGVQHPLDLVDEAHRAGWDVLVDAAAFAPTNRFDVAAVRPEFAVFSLYKIIGYPTGIGCLLVRRDRAATLARPWFAGGTVTIASVQGDGHYLHADEAGFEDGTVDYLSLPAVGIGLSHIERVGLGTIHYRVECLTRWLLDTLETLRHSTGRALVRVHGPTHTTDRGGTVAFTLDGCEGLPIDVRRFERLANVANISLRTGCFCNPGASEIAHHLGRRELARWFRGQPMSELELREQLLSDFGVLLGAVRVSVGIATTFADVYRFVRFAEGFLDRTAREINKT
jgi:molybdenum cofactor sulfurtransferase